MKNVIIVLLFLLQLTACTHVTRLDLAGQWTVRLDSTDVGVTESWFGKLYDTPIALPGTTDFAGLGTTCALKPVLGKPQLLHLTRAYTYIGPAWYAREIEVPFGWEGKELLLHLERVLWDTQVWVDDVKVNGHEESLVTPHRYNLTPYLKAGSKHVLTIRVDNRKRYEISQKELAHAYTEDTQVKWNGILGEMFIEAFDKVYVENLQLYPDAKAHSVKAVATVCNTLDVKQTVSLALNVNGKTDKKNLGRLQNEVELPAGVSHIEIECKLDDATPLWSEFTPYLCQAAVEISGENISSQLVEEFGLRLLERDKNRLMLNGNPLFLRGTLECCIFPLTGTPPTDDESWQKVFGAAREYGMNHLRFHSWCPPEAAFRVADEMGFYLQVELPVWSVTLGKDQATIDYLRAEARRISLEYGNHPSFCLWSLGNELQYDFDVMASMLKEMKEADTRHLYTTTSYTFERGHGAWPEPNDDFFITQKTKKGWIRGQGVFNQEKPSFDKDFRASVDGMEVPTVTHEVGQYSVYPDLSEIAKYTGTLLPLNFMAVRNDLEKKGRLDKASAYLQASGKLAAILYKEEVERALKTPGISGFQLLDLHDFHGQGTALVGLLNAFWESKGIITGQEFREFCSPVVPLLRFPKAVYTNDETFEAEIELCNYGAEDLKDKNFVWEISKSSQLLGNGKVPVSVLTIGHNGNLGKIKIPLAQVEKASKLEIRLQIEGTGHCNRWNIWVYPNDVKPEWKNVKYTRDYAEALALLQKGNKVLFNPDWRTMKGVEGKFVPVFWSPVHFPKQAASMGVLCNPAHPALTDFPTDMHTDWQWWDLNINSTTLVADSLHGGKSIVEVVDNFVNNRSLTSLYEGSVGEGKLMLATFDLQKSLDKRPVARQMLMSVLNYMNSAEFNPSPLTGFDGLDDVFGTVENKKQAVEGIY